MYHSRDINLILTSKSIFEQDQNGIKQSAYIFELIKDQDELWNDKDQQIFLKC